jgi:hypothetical protein
MKGGTIRNYADKLSCALSDEQFAKHLSGEQFIGIYPLLKDDLSGFSETTRNAILEIRRVLDT